MPDDVRGPALAAGATTVLAKPVPLADLLPALGLEPGAGPAPTAETAAPSEPAGLRGRVLVVDDDAEVRDILAEMLHLHGHTVIAVGSAADAARAVAEHRPDVMLLDIYMPGLSGVDALPVLRAMAPDTRVIMVSGSTDEQAARRALTYGAFDCVVKPVEFGRLTDLVQAALLLSGRGPRGRPGGSA